MTFQSKKEKKGDSSLHRWKPLVAAIGLQELKWPFPSATAHTDSSAMVSADSHAVHLWPKAPSVEFRIALTISGEKLPRRIAFLDIVFCIMEVAQESLAEDIRSSWSTVRTCSTRAGRLKSIDFERVRRVN